MMTGQPYKSPEAAPAAEEEDNNNKAEEGTPTTSPASLPLPPPPSSPPTSTSTSTSLSAAAVRGVSTMSARLQRQRLANQAYKDAWAAADPTLRALITPAELAGVAAAAGLGPLADEDVRGLLVAAGPDGEPGAAVSCE